MPFSAVPKIAIVKLAGCTKPIDAWSIRQLEEITQGLFVQCLLAYALTIEVESGCVGAGRRS
jgi:hypothetical protein